MMSSSIVSQYPHLQCITVVNDVTPRDAACANEVFAVVILSISLSVTFLTQVETAKYYIIKLFVPSYSAIILVFSCRSEIRTGSPSLATSGYEKFAITNSLSEGLPSIHPQLF